MIDGNSPSPFLSFLLRLPPRNDDVHAAGCSKQTSDVKARFIRRQPDSISSFRREKLAGCSLTFPHYIYIYGRTKGGSLPGLRRAVRRGKRKRGERRGTIVRDRARKRRRSLAELRKVFIRDIGRLFLQPSFPLAFTAPGNKVDRSAVVILI